MAVKHYSKQCSLQLSLILFLSFSIVLLWTMGQWIFYGYDKAYSKLTHLINTQRDIILPVTQGSLLSVLPFASKPIIAFSPPNTQTLTNHPLFNDLIDTTQQLIQLVLKSCDYLAIKCMMLVAALPLFAANILAGFIDGLNQRAIRTACLGRESSYVFHRLHHYLKKFALLFLMSCLALPVTIHPAAVFMPAALMMGAMVAMTTSRFKKYV